MSADSNGGRVFLRATILYAGISFLANAVWESRADPSWSWPATVFGVLAALCLGVYVGSGR